MYETFLAVDQIMDKGFKVRKWHLSFLVSSLIVQNKPFTKLNMTSFPRPIDAQYDIWPQSTARRGKV